MSMLRSGLVGRPAGHRIVARSVAVATALSFLVLAGPPPAGATAGRIREFLIPGDTPGPQEIAVGSDGALWFTAINAGIGRLGPDGFSNFPLPSSDAQANDITAGPDGALWFTETYGDRIGRVTTAGQITEFPISCPCPDGIEPWGITAGPDGALWFAEYEAGALGRITTSGHIRQIRLPAGHDHPLSIVVGPDGALWFTDDAGISRIGPDGTVSLVWRGEAYSVTAGPDGNLWFSLGTDAVGRLTPSGRARIFPLRWNCFPQELASGAGALWFGCYFSDEVDRISTGGMLTRFPVPHHFPDYPDTIAGMVQGPGHAMWFTEYAGQRIGRISTS